MKIKINDDALISHRGAIELEKLNGFSQKDIFLSLHNWLFAFSYTFNNSFSIELLREINWSTQDSFFFICLG